MSPATHPRDQRRLRHLRLRAQGLRGPLARRPEAAVARCLGTQAQNLPGALWSVARRTRGHRRLAVTRALEQGGIVQAWLMRGTLHLVAAQDLRWLLALTAPRTRAALAAMCQASGVTDPDVGRAADASRAALAAGPLPRVELLAAIEAAGQSTDGHRGGVLLRRLGAEGVLVEGAPRGSTRTFDLLDARVPPAAALSREEALARLVLRYVAGHGPAADRDVARWADLPLRDVRLGVAAAGDVLTSIELAGTSYLVEPALLCAPGPPRGADAHLLAGFDEYHIGHADRRHLLSDEDAPLAGPGRNGIFKPVLLRDGRAVALWSTARRAGPTSIAVTDLPGAGASGGLDDDAVARELARYAAFVGAPVALEGAAGSTAPMPPTPG